MSTDHTHADVTDEAFDAWRLGSFGSDHTTLRLREMLTGEYPLDEAREDALSFMKIPCTECGDDTLGKDGLCLECREETKR